MADLQESIARLQAACRDPRAQMDRYLAQGKKVVGCFAPWAPEELVHASGIHATVAGVLLGFMVPVIRRIPGDGHGLAEHFEHRWRPVSAGFAVPVFAFFAAGVTIGGFSGLGDSLSDPVAIGIVVLLAGLFRGLVLAASRHLVS